MITAGNACGIDDCAAFFVLADAAAATAAGHQPIARLVSHAVAGLPNEIMGEGPFPATRLALRKAGLTLDRIDAIESKEAFAAQAIAVARGLGPDMARTNPNWAIRLDARAPSSRPRRCTNRSVSSGAMP